MMLNLVHLDCTWPRVLIETMTELLSGLGCGKRQQYDHLPPIVSEGEDSSIENYGLWRCLTSKVHVLRLAQAPFYTAN